LFVRGCLCLGTGVNLLLAPPIGHTTYPRIPHTVAPPPPLHDIL